MEQPDAIVLTAIGIGAAFSVLIFLLVAVLVIRFVSHLIVKEDDETEAQEEAGPDPEIRNRATAAAIAVTALIESRPSVGRARRDRTG